MRKIPTLILALFILASNLVASPLFAIANDKIFVTATVLEHITINTNNGHVVATTNAPQGVWIITDNALHNKIYVTTRF